MSAVVPPKDETPPGPHDLVKVYVAGPYTNGDPCANVHQMIRVANRLLDLGYVPFVPLLAHFWHTMTPRPYEDWMRIDLAFLPTCDVFLRIPGTSKGADIEEAAARRHGKPIFNSVEDLVATVEPHKRCQPTTTLRSSNPRNLHCVK